MEVPRDYTPQIPEEPNTKPTLITGATAVHGRWYLPKSSPPPTKPNWREWAYTPAVKVWEACALSMNIEPHSMRAREHGWMGGYGSLVYFEHTNAAEQEEFELRQRVFMANLSHENLDARRPNLTIIRLSDFSFFAVSIVKWEGLPPELVALARVPKREEAPATTIPDEAPEQTGAAPSGTSLKAAPEVAQDDDAGQVDVATTVALEKEETPAQRRANHDMTTERGCRRAILEAWGTIETRYGPKADGRQVLRVLTGTKTGSEEAPQLKTIQNRLIDLRKEKLIPG